METRGVDMRRVRALSSAAIRGHKADLAVAIATGVNLDTKCDWYDPDGGRLVGVCPPGLRGPFRWQGFYAGTPMLWAALGDHIELVGTLLNSGVDVDACDGAGRTALHYAAMFQNKPLAVLLHEHLADFSADRNRNTPLHFAAVHQDTSMATYLFAHGAHIDAKSANGSRYNVTPFYNAYVYHREDMMRMLLDNGAEYQEPCGDPQRSITSASAERLEQTTVSDHTQQTTVSDHALYARAHGMLVAEPARREARRLVQFEAFAMGHHERLGAESRVRALDTGVVRLVMEYL